MISAGCCSVLPVEDLAQSCVLFWLMLAACVIEHLVFCLINHLCAVAPTNFRTWFCSPFYAVGATGVSPHDLCQKRIHNQGLPWQGTWRWRWRRKMRSMQNRAYWQRLE